MKKLRLPKISFLKNTGTDLPFVAESTNFGIKSHSSA